MLGDCSAETVTIKWGYRLRFYMSIVNNDLIYHLYSIFKPYVGTAPKEIVRKYNKLTGQNHTDIYFSTLP